MNVNPGVRPQPQKMSPTGPDISEPGERNVVWVRISPPQVVRTVVVALLTAAVVLGSLVLLWQVRTFVGWFFIALFLAAAINPAVDWLQRRHRLIKRPLAIGLTYLGLAAALLFMAGIFLPVLVDQIRGLAKFVAAAANAPEGPTKYLEELARQNGLGGLFERFGNQLADLRKQLGQLLRNLFLSTGAIAVSAAGFVGALASILTLAFFLVLGSERYANAGVGRPLKPTQIGVVSYCSGCAAPGYPAVFTEVSPSSNRNFIIDAARR